MLLATSKLPGGPSYCCGSDNCSICRCSGSHLQLGKEPPSFQDFRGDPQSNGWSEDENFEKARLHVKKKVPTKTKRPSGIPSLQTDFLHQIWVTKNNQTILSFCFLNSAVSAASLSGRIFSIFRRNTSWPALCKELADLLLLMSSGA